MATDSMFGEVRKFEDFLVTAIADLPEIDIDSGNTATEVVAGAADGRVRLTQTGTNDDGASGVGFGALNWTAGDAEMSMEARIIISDVTDYKLFVGFGDQIVSSAETTFSMTTDTVTIDTQSDAIGIAFDGDATTAVLWAVAGKSDAVTVGKALSAKYNPVAATPVTLGVHLSQDRKTARWYVNGSEVYQLTSASTLIAAVDLVPEVYAYDQATACTIDVDYIYARKGRSTT